MREIQMESSFLFVDWFQPAEIIEMELIDKKEAKEDVKEGSGAEEEEQQTTTEPSGTS